jgi:hypothetical protein
VVVVGTWIALLGTGFFIVALIFAAFRVQNRILLRRLRTAPRLDCGALLKSGRLPRSVLVTGTTAPGPAGLLRSAAYDTASVWFQTDVIRVYDDSTPPDELRSQSTELLKRSAGGPIGIADSTGTVLLDLKLILTRGRVIVRRRREEAALSRTHRADEAGRGMARLEETGLLPASAYGPILARRSDLREDVIEPGQRITVLARPGRDRSDVVLLGLPGAVSTSVPEAWIENLQAVVAADAMMLKLFPVGLALVTAGVMVIAVGAHSA